MKAVVFAVLAAMFWGAAPALEKLGLARVSPLAGLSIRCIAIAGVMLIVIVAGGQMREIAQVKFSALVYLVLAAISAGIVGQLFYFSALKIEQSSLVVPIVGAYPLITAVIGVLILKESLTWSKGAGILLIIVGVVMLGWKR